VKLYEFLRVGRGTRLFDGKDYFTIYDFFSQSHEHFNDPEWDGEPLEPEPTQPKEPCKILVFVEEMREELKPVPFVETYPVSVRSDLME